MIIKYIYNGKAYKTDKSDSNIQLMESIADGKTVVVIKTNGKIENIKASYTLSHNFSSKDRIFANGYQSWTKCREYAPTDRMKGLNRVFSPLIKALGLAGSGDYLFKKYAKKSGVFHGYSYSYIRQGDSYKLLCSLNEKTGYTIFNIDCNNNSIIIEKELQGLTINGEYELFNFGVFNGAEDVVFDMYFAELGVKAPKVGITNGYCSWYNYYTKVTQQDIEQDLSAFVENEVNADLFQLDDGYQTAVGDWLTIKEEKFPKGMKYIADIIHDKGMKAGIWLAPLSAQVTSNISKNHSDWLVKDSNGKPILNGLNWGGYYALDIYNKEARAYIKNVFHVILNDWGYDMVKLDFLFGACIVPRNNKTRGEIMFDAMDFIRECVGDKLILGCGVPLAPAFGKVDYCRIGADVGLKWGFRKLNQLTHNEDVSTINTLNNSIFRRHLNGRAFVNDPDVILLRDYNIKMTFEQRKVVAEINKLFGGLLFVSDRISLYNKEQMQVFKDVYKKKQITIISAEYISKYEIQVVYKEENKTYTKVFDMKNGQIRKN